MKSSSGIAGPARRRSSVLGIALLVLPAVFFSLSGTVQAIQEEAVWVGGTGNWNTAGNWSPAVVPNNGAPVGTTYNVKIDNGSATNSSVSLNTTATIDQLTIDSGDSLGVNTGKALTIAGGGIPTPALSARTPPAPSRA